jgi:hypothetical protein
MEPWKLPHVSAGWVPNFHTLQHVVHRYDPATRQLTPAGNEEQDMFE